MRLLPRIVNPRSAGLEVRHIPGDQNQIILQRGCRDQRIRIRWSACPDQPSPSICDAESDRQDVVRKCHKLLRQPFLKGHGLAQIPATTIFDAAADFSDRDHAQSALQGIVSERPSEDASVGEVLLAQFGDEIRIEQIPHQNSLRFPFPDFRSRSNSKSGAILPSSKNASNKVRGLSPASVATVGTSSSAALKMRRCSSSADTPCRAARCFNDFASASGTFLTSNWAMPSHCYQRYQISTIFLKCSTN